MGRWGVKRHGTLSREMAFCSRLGVRKEEEAGSSLGTRQCG